MIFVRTHFKQINLRCMYFIHIRIRSILNDAFYAKVVALLFTFIHHFMFLIKCKVFRCLAHFMQMSYLRILCYVNFCLFLYKKGCTASYYFPESKTVAHFMLMSVSGIKKRTHSAVITRRQ